ncbi:MULTISPECIES: hypothetical protein [unclassified Shinella]|uniref:hypothetical protein n=1 Tax=unclassified Shinella TaxID=2643062 RepID=UPI00234F7F37|nr:MULTISPECIES: hypothetical protein [unclassified Shinella]MCO5151858.1 hypothetical protein [Shinella sp.]MDC7265460.1 hypothetical protein [Shinella sp. HY16]MDC7272357.1 hypothetical protein [Shinella sp. YZ44]
MPAEATYALEGRTYSEKIKRRPRPYANDECVRFEMDGGRSGRCHQMHALSRPESRLTMTAAGGTRNASAFMFVFRWHLGLELVCRADRVVGAEEPKPGSAVNLCRRA